MKLHNKPNGSQQSNWLHFTYAAAEAEAWDMASYFVPLLKTELTSFADSVQLDITGTLIHLLEVQLIGVVLCCLSKSISC